jgi:hypothetical protein
MAKATTMAAGVLDTTLEEAHMEAPATRRLTVTERSPGHGRSSESTSTGKQSAREPPPCLNTKKCAGENHFLSDCPHTGKDEAMALLSEYKKKRDADKKKANFKTLGNNRATS